MSRGRLPDRARRATRSFIAALAVVPLVAPQFWVTLGNYIGLYSIVALGLVLLTGVAGQTSFGQAAFVGLGAYTTAILSTHFALSPWVNLVDRTGAHVGALAFPGPHHAAHARALSAARDDRLGVEPVLPVRQSGVPRRPYGPHQHSVAQSSSAWSCATSATSIF